MNDTQTITAGGQDLDLAPIEARVDALPPGAWAIDWETCDCDGDYPCGHGAHAIKIGPILIEIIDSPGHAAIAAFVGAARQDVPALVTETRRLRERLALYETPPSSTDENYLAQLRETFVDTLTTMAESEASPERAADALMVYAKVALWAVERERDQIAAWGAAIGDLSLAGILEQSQRLASAQRTIRHLRSEARQARQQLDDKINAHGRTRRKLWAAEEEVEKLRGELAVANQELARLRAAMTGTDL